LIARSNDDEVSLDENEIDPPAVMVIRTGPAHHAHRLTDLDASGRPVGTDGEHPPGCLQGESGCLGFSADNAGENDKIQILAHGSSLLHAQDHRASKTILTGEKGVRDGCLAHGLIVSALRLFLE